MSQDVLTVGSTMRIPLLYRGEYSQWVDRFMNYLEEQTDGEAMINLIKNGDQPLPRVTQVYIAGTSSTEQPPLKNKSMWSNQEKRIQKTDRLTRSLLIQVMSSSNHPIIVASDSDIENAFSTTNVPDYFPATPGKTSPDSSNDLTKYLLAALVFSPLHDDLYIEIIQASDATNNELHIPPLKLLLLHQLLYIETPVESLIPISPSSLVGSSSPVRSTTPPDYPFDKSIFAELDNSLWIIPLIIKNLLKQDPRTQKQRECLPRTLTSKAPAMTQVTIKKLVAVSVFAALEAQAANMENTDNTTRQRETPDCKVKFTTGTLTEDALSWWNSYAKPIGIEQADKITWTELKRILTNNPNIMPNSEKLMEVFIGGLPRSIEGNVTASKPQTLEESITITQRLMKRQNRKQETFRTYTGYTGNRPLCERCTLHYIGPCTVKCQTYNKIGCILSWLAISLGLRFAYLKTICCVLLKTKSAKLKLRCVLPQKIAFFLQEDLAFCLQEDLAFCL
nr:hypothetical protein [Tanacetum cinerariifolium]